MLTILNIVQKMQPHCAQQLEYTLSLQNMDTSILWTHSSGPNSLHFRGVPLYTNNYQARACVIRPLFLLKGRGLLKILVWHQTNIFSTRPGNVNEMLGKHIVWLTFCLERLLLRNCGCGTSGSSPPARHEQYSLIHKILGHWEIMLIAYTTLPSNRQP